jgi:hypothetical protein
MSFGESMFLVGFNQKTAKEDLFIKRNHGIPPRKQRGKNLVGPAGPTDRPPSLWAPLSAAAMSVLHCLKDCISDIY